MSVPTPPPVTGPAALESSKEYAVLRALNRAFKADPAAMHALVCNRVPCNLGLADDPTIVVDADMYPGTYTVGALGLLNGVLDAAGLSLIASIWSEARPDGTRVMTGFTEYRPSPIEPVKPPPPPPAPPKR